MTKASVSQCIYHYHVTYLVAFAYHEHSWCYLSGSGADCESVFLSWGFGTGSVFFLFASTN